MPRALRTLAAAATLALPFSLWGCGTSAEPVDHLRDTGKTDVTTSAVKPYKPAAGIFSAKSEWRRDVSRAPMSEDSDALVRNLNSQVSTRYGGIAAFNLTRYNNSFYEVPRETPLTTVRFDDCQHKGYIPKQLYEAGEGAHFRDVPIPAEARPASGTDAELSIYKPATDQLWELWHAKQSDGVWSACWGGRLDHVSRSAGYFPDGMGASASGLAISGGDIGIAEAQRGRIDHALELAIPSVAHYSTFSYPAQRSDGGLPLGSPAAIEEGRRFRLDPSIDVNSLPLSPLARIVARAAQRYGFIVTDKSGAVSVIPESGAGVKAARGIDPWSALTGGVPSYQIMRDFPWDRLQALTPDYGK